jgi:Fe2+ or Zn2+ uptake regulation protein
MPIFGEESLLEFINILIRRARNRMSETAVGRTNYLEDCKRALKAAGARVTKPRISVILCLSAASKPLSARDVFEQISERSDLVAVDQVTIYRILEMLSDLGLVHQVFPTGGYMACFHSKCFHAQHVLTRCVKCESIDEIDIPQESVAPMLWYLKNQLGFEADEHVFQMNGVCANCEKTKD